MDLIISIVANSFLIALHRFYRSAIQVKMESYT